MAVITSSVAKTIFVLVEITFKVIVITSLVVNITFVVAEITFNAAMITSAVAKKTLMVAYYVEYEVQCTNRTEKYFAKSNSRKIRRLPLRPEIASVEATRRTKNNNYMFIHIKSSFLYQ